MRFILVRFSVEKMHFSLIGPILEYGDVIWNNSTMSIVNKLECVQIKVMRIVTGGIKLTSINKLYEETGWEKLSDKREKNIDLYYYIVLSTRKRWCNCNR